MQFEWLNKKNNKNLIVFFNGWGSIKPKELGFGNFDVIIFQDYRSFELKNIDFSFYEKKYLISWSMGVYVCNFYYDILKNFDGFTAINGTLMPVNDKYGIPVEAYNLTVKNFNELTCKKFIKKIGTTFEIQKSISDLKQELISIRDLKIDKYLNFNKVIIAVKDKIFPYKNMILFWEEKNVKIIEIESPHYIFDLYNNWSDFI